MRETDVQTLLDTLTTKWAAIVLAIYRKHKYSTTLDAQTTLESITITRSTGRFLLYTQ